MKTFIPFCMILMAFGWQPTAQAAGTPEYMAVLAVMGYGYTVKVSINGADAGVKGGKSENRRLFNQDHEMAKQALPAIRAQNFVLKPGENRIAVEYTKTDPKSSDTLEVKLELEGYPEPVFLLQSKAKSSGKIEKQFVLQKPAPKDFKSIVVNE